MKIKFTCAAVALALAGSGGAQAQAPSGATVPVTADNFPRAESDLYFGGVVKNGGFSKFDHTRTPAPLDKQTVIRLNRDTLYSAEYCKKTLTPLGVLKIPAIKSKFARLTANNETVDSVMMTLQTETGFFDDEELIDDLSSENTFDFRTMRDELTTVYVIIPVMDIERNAKWLRLVILSAMRAFTDTEANPALGPVLFLMDEFAALGHLRDMQ